jgi:hypothetical protein
MNVSDAAVEQTYAEIMKMYCVGSYLKMLPCMGMLFFLKYYCYLCQSLIYSSMCYIASKQKVIDYI